MTRPTQEQIDTAIAWVNETTDRICKEQNFAMTKPFEYMDPKSRVHTICQMVEDEASADLRELVGVSPTALDRICAMAPDYKY